MPPVAARALPESPFPLFPVLYPPPLPAPSAALPSRLIVWLSQPARSVSISRYPVHLPPVHFLLPPLFLSFARWPREIHETKFMITTSKQRAARHGGYLPRCPLYIPFASPSHLPPLLADPNRSSAAPQLLLRPISPAFRHSSSPCSPRLLPPSPSFHHSSSTLSVRKGRRLFERASLPRDWLAFSDRCVRRVEQDTRHARFPPPLPPRPVEIIAFVFVSSFVAVRSRGNAPSTRSRVDFASICSISSISFDSCEHGVTINLRLSSSSMLSRKQRSSRWGERGRRDTRVAGIRKT